VSTWLGWLTLQLVAGVAADQVGRAAGELAALQAPRAVVDLADSAAVVYPTPARTREIGVLRRGSVHVVLETATGEGCASGWLRIGDEAWICGWNRTLREDRPRAEPWPPAPSRWAPLPFLYVHPLGRGRRLYGSPDDAIARVDGRDFPPGTWDSVNAAFYRSGTPLFRTVAGEYLRQDDVRWAAASALSGFFPDPAGAPWPYAFVAVPVADVWAEPPPRRSWEAARRSGERLPHYVVVRVEEQGERWVRVGEERFVRRADVRLFRPQPRPDGVGPDERWFDVDLTEQVFAAYEGDVPRFVTLTSAGRGTLTREGSFRIFRAAGTQTMRGIPIGDGRRTYEVRDVPWVLFFDGDRAIHGAFWHDEFGTARSHGCVNLAPAAARWVFGFAQPAVPDGWISLAPADPSRSTLVHVHR
jgi:hypothetical protein